MVSLESLRIEYKTGAVMGMTALVLSLIIGLIVGNEFLYSLGRAFFFGVLFASLGFGVVIIVRKYVPDVLVSTGSEGEHVQPVDAPENVEIAEGVSGSGPVSSPEAGGSYQGSSANDAVSGSESDEVSSADFEPLGDYYKKQQLSSEQLDPVSSGSGSIKKMGRHLLEEKGVKYEPKIMAEAIRTMMSKDK
jgi:hypothetical protein